MADAPDDGTLAPGVVFGRYTIVRVLGAGGMGCVYEAIHGDLKKRVALKTLHRVVAMDPSIRARFVQEGQAASRIRHPHVVDVSDVGVQDDLPFLVMEFLEGEDLRGRFGREKTVPAETLTGLLLPVLSAVSAAHEEGIVHRDLKPENIFLARTRDRSVVSKVLDFGISKMNDADRKSGLTSSSSMLGTPFYMAPEQAIDSKSVDARADIYALGVILYEGLTGQVPYKGENLFAVLTAASKGGCASPRQLNPAVTEALESVVLRAMAVSPKDRYADVRGFAYALLPFASVGDRARWASVFDGSPETDDPPSHRTDVERASTISAAPAPSIVSSPEVVPPKTPAPARRVVWAAGAAVFVAVVAAVGLSLRGPAALLASPALAAPVRAAPAPAPVALPTPVVAAPVAPPTPVVAAPVAESDASVAAAAPTVEAPAEQVRGHHRHRRGDRGPASVTSVNGAPLID